MSVLEVNNSPPARPDFASERQTQSFGSGGTRIRLKQATLRPSRPGAFEGSCLDQILFPPRCASTVGPNVQLMTTGYVGCATIPAEVPASRVLHIGSVHDD